MCFFHQLIEVVFRITLTKNSPKPYINIPEILQAKSLYKFHVINTTFKGVVI